MRNICSDENGNPWTAHTTNPVPLILVEGEGRKIPDMAEMLNYEKVGG